MSPDPARDQFRSEISDREGPTFDFVAGDDVVFDYFQDRSAKSWSSPRIAI
jgi:hypothetical protein